MRIKGSTSIYSTDPLILQSAEWNSAGIVHGFAGKELNFNTQDCASSWKSLKESFSLTSLYLSQQVHGKMIWDLRGQRLDGTDIVRGGNADAILADRVSESRVALGVVTADCVPLILRSATMMAVVHAGWRGLAAGVIQKVIKLFPNDTKLEIVIGPCAGNSSYEVGDEVVNVLAPFAVTAIIEQKLILDLQATSIKVIDSCRQGIAITTLPYCTINDPRFYSVRREGATTGRNLGFIKLS